MSEGAKPASLTNGTVPPPPPPASAPPPATATIRLNNLQKIQLRKQQCREWSRAKKFEKLATYSTCKVSCRQASVSINFAFINRTEHVMFVSVGRELQVQRMEEPRSNKCNQWTECPAPHQFTPCDHEWSLPFLFAQGTPRANHHHLAS